MASWLLGSPDRRAGAFIAAGLGFTTAITIIVGNLLGGMGRSEDAHGIRPDHGDDVKGAPLVELRKTPQGYFGMTTDRTVMNLRLITGQPDKTDRNALGDIGPHAKVTDETVPRLEDDNCVGVEAVVRKSATTHKVYTGKACENDGKTTFYHTIDF